MSEILRCPVTAAQLVAIDALIERTGQTRAEWLQQMVGAALSETPSNIRQLSERVAALELAQGQLSTLSKTVEQLAHQVAMLDGAEQRESVLVANDGEDEDAPDEILYDFLDAQTAGGVSPNVSSGLLKEPSGSAKEPSIYDAEDEPDEVLSDFLDLEASPSMPSGPVKEPSIYDAEDEPDEVLYDFLDSQD